MENPRAGNEIRRAFIDYFASKGHRIVRSSNLVPSADPTLLFTNSGMVQFKDLFLGREKRAYARAVTSQKCLRVSGKHNDLEDVGRTRRHNTFFEMLGNFSFGDYFKQEAIAYAWEFFTDVMKLPPEKLSITVYEKDQEAGNIWSKTAGVPNDKIIAMGEKDNFWSMGPVGPCGPCSEIYIDHGPSRGCGRPDCGPACEHCDRHEELWNLVFMQYNRNESGELEPLPRPNIDTGMGLERLASIMQNVDSNFDTDLIRPVIARAEEALGRGYGASSAEDVSFRVIGDHARAAAFLITEGILPSNDDRGYILRRLMRRAMRHGKMLGATGPFLYRVTGAVIDNFKDVFPELREAEATMAKIIKSEEERFGRTLEAGLRILNDLVEKTRSQKRAAVDGAELFKLYDTYGFPPDLAGDVIKDAGLGIDRGGFDAELENQRTMARKGAKAAPTKTPEAYVGLETEKTEFTGYQSLEETSEIKLIVVDGKRTSKIAKGDKGDLVLAKTPFYAESGGQAGDSGTISGEGGACRVENSGNVMGMIVHRVLMTDGELRSGEVVSAKVNGENRAGTARNHSATHLLQAALKNVLGEHVKQSGSLVNPERLRFDFSHYTATTPEELLEVEEAVNQKIMEDLPVRTTVMDVEKAMESGATALFGEKYGASVRVVEMGGYSKELCGGTHVAASGRIGFFKIISETGVAAGIRRVEAVTGKNAFEYVAGLENKLKEVAGLVKCRPEESPERVQKFLDKTRELERSVKKLQADLIRGGGEAETSERDVRGVRVVVRNCGDVDPASLRELVDEMKAKAGSGVIAVGAARDGKATLAVGVTKDLEKKVNAGSIIKEAAAIVGGKGGGRPDMAQAGGPNADKLPEALEAIFSIVEKMVG
ncbi:MAG: alanine--tRNA ligase [Nitrospinae bacterium]|nr:alanine--tRNA ligase [Nitrospinota bacterium]